MLKKFYRLAVAEGEGLGTAYEYASKYRILKPYLNNKSVLIHGLPEKYGFSLDFLYLFDTLSCEVHVYDERKEKTAVYHELVKRLSKNGIIRTEPKIVDKIKKQYDIILSSEVIQRLDGKKLEEYFTIIKACSKKAVVFFPNGNNKAHCVFTKLRSIKPERVLGFFSEGAKAGFVDMPPFPPGLRVKSSQTRHNLRLLIPLLGLWLLIEKICPIIIKKHFCHIAYIQFEKHV